ncbi:stress response protein [Desulfobacterales bacterium HSG2]|nr:stress response protein [Desulfobacterales bacterium HSG2]
MELKQKGANAEIGAFKQLKLSLIWTSAVDLDLMAFYKTKDGRVGGIYSDNYAGGSLGDLNQFPFIELSGDAGVGAVGGDNREELRITKLDDFEELYIAALNFTDASSASDKVFADYDARVEVITDKGDTHTVALDSGQSGSVAILCKFASSFMGASLVNNSEVMNFEAFKTAVPGASAIKLASKVVLKQKGEKTGLSGNDFQATLRWKTAVDLDLHCFYRIKSGVSTAPKGILGKLLGGGSAGGEGQIYFSKRGSKTDAPWIYLDQDAGIGDVGGDNEENIYFTRLDQIEHALIVANIYNKPNANFASYDGLVIVRGGGREIEVPLTEREPGAWCVIARIDNSGGSPQLINVNKTQRTQPNINQFV